MGKHSAENTKSRRRHRRTLFILNALTMIFMFLVLLILSYILFNKFFIHVIDKPKDEPIDKTPSVEASDFTNTVTPLEKNANNGIVSILENVNIENSNFLIIKDFKIDNTNPEYPKISGKVYNSTSDVQSDLSIDLTLYDESQTIIDTLNFTFEVIEANSFKTFFSVQTYNLSDCVYYSAKVQ